MERARDWLHPPHLYDIMNVPGRKAQIMRKKRKRGNCLKRESRTWGGVLEHDTQQVDLAGAGECS